MHQSGRQRVLDTMSEMLLKAKISCIVEGKRLEKRSCNGL